MKYCYNCNRITPGEPSFCNSCGRSYNVKLCPRKHSNPRSALACSECGSRDLSTPQPRVPIWAQVLAFFVSFLPGLLLFVFSALAIVGVLADAAQNPQHGAAIVILLGLLWWMWSLIPQWFREAVYRFLKRKRDGEERR